LIRVRISGARAVAVAVPLSTLSSLGAWVVFAVVISAIMCRFVLRFAMPSSFHRARPPHVVHDPVVDWLDSAVHRLQNQVNIIDSKLHSSGTQKSDKFGDAIMDTHADVSQECDLQEATGASREHHVSHPCVIQLSVLFSQGHDPSLHEPAQADVYHPNDCDASESLQVSRSPVHADVYHAPERKVFPEAVPHDCAGHSEAYPYERNACACNLHVPMPSVTQVFVGVNESVSALMPAHTV